MKDESNINNQIGSTAMERSEIEQKIAELKKQLPKKDRKPKKLPVAISPEDFLELLKHTNQRHHKLAFLLAFESGLRISEVIKLKPENVDLKLKKIFLSQAKGSKDRVVGLPKHFKNDYLSLIPIKCGERALEKAFKVAARKAGILERMPTAHFHSLRHGFASHLASKGMPLHHLRTLMGHSNISTTNVYLELNPNQALKSAEELF